MRCSLPLSLLAILFSSLTPTAALSKKTTNTNRDLKAAVKSYVYHVSDCAKNFASTKLVDWCHPDRSLARMEEVRKGPLALLNTYHV